MKWLWNTQGINFIKKYKKIEEFIKHTAGMIRISVVIPDMQGDESCARR